MSPITYKDITIVYEDNHVLVAIKPAGVLSQSDGSDAPDMLTLLKEYIKEKYNKSGAVYLGLLHRLDRPVSGIMVFARTSKCASRISEQIRRHEVVKKYKAVVEGDFVLRNDYLCHYAVKDEKNNITKIYDKAEAPQKAKEVKLKYEVVSSTVYRNKTISLLDIELITGRSHQIRTQMRHVGHPLLGDARYGSDLYRGDIALVSYLIGFRHPISNEYQEFRMKLKDQKPWSFFGDF